MNSIPLVLIIILLIIVIVALIIRLNLNQPTTINHPPVYIYGFNSAAPREISGSTGLLSFDNDILKLAPINKSSTQQWNLIKTIDGLVIQNLNSLNYIGPDLKMVPKVNEALKFKILGPFRDGRVYYIITNSRCLQTNSTGSIILSDFKEQNNSINAEWLIVFGSCQDKGMIPSEFHM
jgi:hypothetical protein